MLINWWHGWGQIVLVILGVVLMVAIAAIGQYKNRVWLWGSIGVLVLLLLNIPEIILRQQPPTAILYLALIGSGAAILLGIGYLIYLLAAKEPAPVEAVPAAYDEGQPFQGFAGTAGYESQPNTQEVVEICQVCGNEIPIGYSTCPQCTRSDISEPRDQTIIKKALATAWLTITSRRGQGTRFDLAGEKIKIGRKADNDIVLDDETVSREHAIISKTETGYAILDMISTAGTMVNGSAIREPTLLADADVILLGDTELTFKEIKSAKGGDSR